MRILRPTRRGASPYPISLLTAPTRNVQSDHGWALSPPARVPVTGLLPGGAIVLVSGGLQATPRGVGADLAPEAATMPLAALRFAATEREVRA